MDINFELQTPVTTTHSKCTICYKSIEPSETDKIVNNKVDEQLSVFILLNKIFKIPKLKFQSYLRRNGNPSEWISYCLECSSDVLKAVKTYQQLKCLQSQLNDLKLTLEHRIQKTYCEEIIDALNEKLEVTNDVREFISRRTLEKEDEKAEKYSHLEEKSNRALTKREDFTSQRGRVVKMTYKLEPIDINYEVQMASPNWTPPSENSSDSDDDDIDIKIENEEGKEEKSSDSKRNSTNISRPFKCQYCPSTFSHETKRSKHMSKCTKKEIKTDEKDEIEFRDPNKKYFICKDCFREFQSRPQLKKHRARLHPKEKIKCDLCTQTFLHERPLLKHLMEVHKKDYNPTKPFVCQFERCSKVFGTRVSEKNHRLRVHSVFKSFLCELCSYAGYEKRDLEIHQQSRHKDEMGLVNEFSCNECGKIYATMHSLRHHRNIMHVLEHKFICPYCNEGRPSKSLLDEHMRKHLGKTFQCDICDKKYVRKSALVIHRRSHTGELPYKCPYPDCQRRFPESSNMIKHVRQHEKNNSNVKANKSNAKRCVKTSNNGNVLTL